ncbi:ABC-three component system protein [Allorhodopirellula solitaria]|uniref:ABC-three component systems C-terminal domain-containing protein n=1 Tax=Allorhodopirellula solitaria TaxID=2527987 RepID=A0A5C5XTQ0_9BACT|nr:ABC-three component system protein [Allorhodopirellula solitaria]TWT66656.1 hypothetical protein CA85_27530 [Allorhodopirellula solitaria]
MSDSYDSLTPEQQLYSRAMFRSKIYQSDGQRYQDLFVEVMTLRDVRFRPVKPQGQKGDQGNDGYIPEDGKYFQVYAPEDAKSKIATAAKKAKDDFGKLKKHWEKDAPITDYRFVHNDKFKGSFPDIEHELAKIKKTHSLTVSKAFLAKDLEAEFCKLRKSEMEAVLQAVIPRAHDIADIDFGVLTDVLQHLVENQQPVDHEAMNSAPEFYEKIEFNDIKSTTPLLTVGSYQNAAVEQFFNQHGEFTKTDIRNRLSESYESSKHMVAEQDSSHLAVGDCVFFDLLHNIAPDNTRAVQDATIVLIAYFFEKCDVFEEPLR